jgi:hypothetical protein
MKDTEYTSKKDFNISLRDARRICDGLELAASWDKTSIYYDLKVWIEQQEKAIGEKG